MKPIENVLDELAGTAAWPPNYRLEEADDNILLILNTEPLGTIVWDLNSGKQLPPLFAEALSHHLKVRYGLTASAPTPESLARLVLEHYRPSTL